MSLLELILIFVLQFEAGISVEHIYLYKRSGRDVALPCGREPPSDTRCSNIFWFFNQSLSTPEVDKGKVQKSSARAARLSLDADCSLVINKITAEDVGQYTCRQGTNNFQDVVIYPSVLRISPSNLDADSKKNGEVTLVCSLTKYIRDDPCQQNSLRWVDETGTVLDGEGVGYKVKQKNCFSYLTVTRRSGHNRTYTCQFVDEGKTEVEAHYTPVFTDDQPGSSTSEPFPYKTYIIIGVVVGLVVLLVVIAAVLIKHKKRAKVTEDVQKATQQSDEPESNLTYVTVSHANPLTSPKIKVKEEEVTYSTVKTQAKIEADNDPSSFYSNVSKPI